MKNNGHTNAAGRKRGAQTIPSLAIHFLCNTLASKNPSPAGCTGSPEAHSSSHDQDRPPVDSSRSDGVTCYTATLLPGHYVNYVALLLHFQSKPMGNLLVGMECLRALKVDMVLLGLPRAQLTQVPGY